MLPLSPRICQCMRRFFVKRPKFLAATSNLRVEQNLVHLGRFLHFSQKVVRVTLRRFPKLFTMSSCQYESTIPEKEVHVCRPFKNWHFVRICTERMTDHQYGENGARNIYSNYNQMRAYVECSPNQSKKLYLIDLSN